ncbi:energy transducer TonB [Crenobacter cavernae]|uniref:energy transducer TonB n=1 Tax=Crenobacter cavernae TaxID=2290923 RepID=UPI001C69AA4E|nr:energy transducer TonB [Crenobacter cavernae]
MQTVTFGGVLLAHVGLGALLVSLAHARETITPPKVESLTMVSVAPSTPAPTPPAPEPVKKPDPRPTPKVKTPPKPNTPKLLTAKAPVPAATKTFTAPPEPAPAPSAPPAGATSGEKADKPAAVTPPTHKGGYLNNPRPAYPPLSVELGEEGKVLLRVHVSVDGRAESADVERSSGFPRLDRAALTAVRGWRFVPARRGDEPIAFTYTVPLDFSIKKQTQS